jgi:hypothetical protein
MPKCAIKKKPLKQNFKGFSFPYVPECKKNINFAENFD